MGNMIFFRGNVGPKVSDLTWTIQMFWSYACCFIWLHLVLPLSSEQTQLLSGTTLGNWNPSRLPSLVKQNLKTTGTSIYHLNGQSMFFHAPPQMTKNWGQMFLQPQKLFTPPFAASHSSFNAYITKKAHWKSFTPNFEAIQAVQKEYA